MLSVPHGESHGLPRWLARPGLKPGIRSGEAAVREAAAYLLDTLPSTRRPSAHADGPADGNVGSGTPPARLGFAGVPQTTLAEMVRVLLGIPFIRGDRAAERRAPSSRARRMGGEQWVQEPSVRRAACGYPLRGRSRATARASAARSKNTSSPTRRRRT